MTPACFTAVEENNDYRYLAVQTPGSSEDSMIDAQTAPGRVAFLHGLGAIRQFRSDPVPHAVTDDLLEVAC